MAGYKMSFFPVQSDKKFGIHASLEAIDSPTVDPQVTGSSPAGRAMIIKGLREHVSPFLFQNRTVSSAVSRKKDTACFLITPIPNPCYIKLA